MLLYKIKTGKKNPRKTRRNNSDIKNKNKTSDESEKGCLLGAVLIIWILRAPSFFLSDRRKGVGVK